MQRRFTITRQQQSSNVRFRIKIYTINRTANRKTISVSKGSRSVQSTLHAGNLRRTWTLFQGYLPNVITRTFTIKMGRRTNSRGLSPYQAISRPFRRHLFLFFVRGSSVINERIPPNTTIDSGPFGVTLNRLVPVLLWLQVSLPINRWSVHQTVTNLVWLVNIRYIFVRVVVILIFIN